MSQNDFSPCYRALIISLRFPVFAFAVFTLAVISQVEIEYRLVDAGLIAEFIGYSFAIILDIYVLLTCVLVRSDFKFLRLPRIFNLAFEIAIMLLIGCGLFGEWAGSLHVGFDRSQDSYTGRINYVDWAPIYVIIMLPVRLFQCLGLLIEGWVTHKRNQRFRAEAARRAAERLSRPEGNTNIVIPGNQFSW